MLRRRSSWLYSCALLLSLLLVASTGRASAAPAPGITVTPGLLNFTLSKDAPSQTIPVTVTNGYDSPLTLSAEFKGIDENAGLLVPTDSLEKSFAPALHISETSLTVAPHTDHILQVQVANLDNLAPGGHYATLVLTQQNSGQQQVSLKSAISISLFAVKVAGAETSLSLTRLHTDGWLFRLPTSADLTFRNNGNVHTVPRGVVEVLDKHYQVLAKGIANAQSLPLLPDESLTSQVRISGLSRTLLPQRLLIWVAYRPDGATVQTVVRRTIWYVPPLYPLFLVIIVIGLWLTRRRWQARLRRFAFVRQAATYLASVRQRLQQKKTAQIEKSAAEAPPQAPEPITSTTPPKTKTQPKNRAQKKKQATKRPANHADSAVSTAATQIEVSEPTPDKPLLTLAMLEQRTTTVKTGSKTTTKKRVTPSQKSGRTKTVAKRRKSRS